MRIGKTRFGLKIKPYFRRYSQAEELGDHLVVGYGGVGRCNVHGYCIKCHTSITGGARNWYINNACPPVWKTIE